MVAKIMNVVFTEEEYKKILKEAEDNVRESVTRQVVDKYLKDTSKFIYITENIKFDLLQLELYVNDKLYKLTKNEKKLFEILTKQPDKVVNFNTIFNFIWREDVYDLSKLRSLIYRLKNKLKFNPFENLYEEGYKIKIVKIDENS